MRKQPPRLQFPRGCFPVSLPSLRWPSGFFPLLLRIPEPRSFGGQEATREFALTAPWGSCERIVIRTRNGPVTLTSGDVSQVRIEGVKTVRGANYDEAHRHLNNMEIVAQPDEHAPSTFVVELRMPPGLASLSPGASLSVTVPRPCPAEIQTSNGSIVVSHMDGQFTLSTANGRVELRDSRGDSSIRTSNGRIEVVSVQGSVNAETNNGDVTLRDLIGTAEIRASNGAIQVGSREGDVRATTSNGWIQVAAEPAEGGMVILKTSNGAIRAELPATMKAAVHLRTSNGPVRAEAQEGVLQIKSQGWDFLRGLLNGGGSGEITVEASNGPVTLELH